MHAMKAYGGVKAQLHLVLPSEIDGCEWPGSSPGPFIE